jgi:uncharacterized membrane protein
VPLDQVLQRERDIDAAYSGNETQLEAVINEYNVSYVYVGNDELGHYPGCVARFDSFGWLKPVYTDGSLRIYQVDLVGSGT